MQFLTSFLSNSSGIFSFSLIAWALKRGFFTPRGARPDVYRAANHLLRLVSDGGIALSFMPPGTCHSTTVFECMLVLLCLFWNFTFLQYLKIFIFKSNKISIPVNKNSRTKNILNNLISLINTLNTVSSTLIYSCLLYS